MYKESLVTKLGLKTFAASVVLQTVMLYSADDETYLYPTRLMDISAYLYSV